MLRVGIIYLYGSVAVVAFSTAINWVLNHVGLIDEVSDLPFRDIHSTASELEPIARFTMASSTAWFAGTSVIVLLVLTGLRPLIGLAIILLLIFMGVILFMAPQLALHSALLDAKREAQVKIRKEYEEMQQSLQENPGDAEHLSLQLEMTDRRLKSTNAIRTWPYNPKSVGKLATASIIPWLSVFERIARLVTGFGGS